MKLATLTFLILISLALTSCVFFEKSDNKPDLIITNITPKLCAVELYENGDISCISITIKNAGSTTSDANTLYVWNANFTKKEAKKVGVLDNDLWIFEENTNDGIPLAPQYEIYEKVPSLKAGESITVIVTVDFWIYDPNCEIGALVDAKDEIEESSKENNTQYFFEGG